jgi:hypothetical protein
MVLDGLGAVIVQPPWESGRNRRETRRVVRPVCKAGLAMAEKELLSRNALRERLLKTLRAGGIDASDVRILVLVDSRRNTANWDLASIDPAPAPGAADKEIERICRELQGRYDVETA